jgi:C-terminal processing protease CtpA/Prc
MSKSAFLLAIGLGFAAEPACAQVVGAIPATPDPAVAVALAAAMPALTTLTPQQADNVAALGQVWGLLKYFHPAVAAGQRDWDAEFLRQLPGIIGCKSVQERSGLLSTWVTSLGAVPACSACTMRPSKPIRLATDLHWAQDKRRFSAPLRQQLAFIAANCYQGAPYYVSLAEAGNPTFPHEAAYADQPCPAASLRLLALCRHWNIVQYYYPYRYAVGKEWATVLADLLPRFAAATTPLAYRHAALLLVTRLHDGHATLRDPLLEAEQGNYLVAAAVQFIDNKATVIRVRRDGKVPQPPLEPGDIITHLAGRPVADLVRQQLPETPGSNRAAQLRTIALNLLYTTTSQLDLQVLRGGQSLRIVAPCFKLGTAPPVRPALADSMYRFVAPEVGYIDMARITKAKLPVLMQAFAHAKGIVIDSRNYPGEFVTRSLPGYFLARPVPFATYSVCDTLQPGRFVQLPADTLRPAGPAPYTGQVVVLVNETTLSQAEYNGMALQATPHCTLLGSPTAGADGNVSRIVLPGGLKTAMSGIGIYYPSGRETQRVGLAIDVPVRPTVAGLRTGHDELLDRAIDLITTGHATKPRS